MELTSESWRFAPPATLSAPWSGWRLNRRAGWYGRAVHGKEAAEEQKPRRMTTWQVTRQLLGILLILVIAVLALHMGWDWLISDQN